MSFIDFLIQNYVYILVVLIILILIVIGFIVDKSGKNKKKGPKAPKNKNMDPASPELTPEAPNVSLNQGPTGANTITSPVREVGDTNTNGVNMNTTPLREVPTNETIVPRPINVTENLERPNLGNVNNGTPTVGNPTPVMGQNYGNGMNVTPQNNINRVNQGVNYNPSNPNPTPTIMPNNIQNNNRQITNQMPYNNGNNIGFSAMRPQNNINQNPNQNPSQNISAQRMQGYPTSQNTNTGIPNQTQYQQGVSPSMTSNNTPQNNTYNPLNDMGIRFVTGENNAPKTNAEDNNEWNV